MFGFFKRRKFNKWCDLEGIKSKNPHYFKYFTSLLNNGSSISDIKSIWIDIKGFNNLKYLPKNVISYTDIDSLRLDIRATDYIISSILLSPYKSIFNKSSHQERIRFLSIIRERGIDLLPSKVSTIKDFCELNKFKFEDINTNIKNELISSIERNDKVDLLYDKENIVIIKISDVDNARKYGSKKWCLKNQVNWDKYVGKKSQYFIYNFNFNIDYDYHLLGFTIKEKNCKNCKCVDKQIVRWIFDNDNYQVWNGYDSNFNKSNYFNESDNKWPWKAFKLIKKSINENREKV